MQTKCQRVSARPVGNTQIHVHIISDIDGKINVLYQGCSPAEATVVIQHGLDEMDFEETRRIEDLH
jgi:hypothetical protein